MKSKKKRGRPTLPPGKGKRHPLNMRTTKDVRDQIEAAAAASGRSLVQEVEFRLGESFSKEDNIVAQFGGRGIYSLMKLLADALQIVEGETGKSWRDDSNTYSLILAVYSSILWRYLPDKNRPAKPAIDPSPLVNEIAGVLVGGLKGRRMRMLLDEGGA